MQNNAEAKMEWASCVMKQWEGYFKIETFHDMHTNTITIRM